MDNRTGLGLAHHSTMEPDTLSLRRDWYTGTTNAPTQQHAQPTQQPTQQHVQLTATSSDTAAAPTPIPRTSSSQSYATAASAHHTQHTAQAPRRPPTNLKHTETDRLNRTQIIRRTEYNTTGQMIIQTMTAQLGIPEHRLFESVLRDPRDNRRFYLTYRTMDIKRTVLG